MNPKTIILLMGAIIACYIAPSNSNAMDLTMPTKATSVLADHWKQLTSPAKILLPIAQFRPGLPMRPSARKPPVTVKYSRSATAGNMVTPAILLGAPIMIIIALIFMAMKGD
jgi:hypothetical protein